MFSAARRPSEGGWLYAGTLALSLQNRHNQPANKDLE